MRLKNQTIEVINILTPKKYKFYFVGIFILTLISAMLEIVTIGSVAPLISSIIDYKESNFFFLNYFFNTETNFFKENSFLIIVLIFIFFILISSFLKIYLLKCIYSFTKGLGHFYAQNIFSIVINMNYLQFVKKNSSEFISILETKIDRFVDSIFNFLELISSFVIFVIIASVLFMTNFYLTLVISSFLLISYLLLFYLIKPKLKYYGNLIALNLSQRVKTVQESIGSFRSITLDKKHFFFENFFKEKDKIIRKFTANVGFLGLLPRHLMEMVSIIMLILIAYFLIEKKIYTNAELIIYLGTAGFAIQRLLPNVQKMYFGYSYLLFNAANIKEVINLLDSRSNNNEENDSSDDKTKSLNKKLKFQNKIVLENLTFNYGQEDKKNIFKEINFEIKKNQRIGILGETGVGKSTLVDLLCGLFSPSEGKVTVDGVDIKTNLPSWYEKISYVPQNIFLMDASIYENIAFEVSIENIEKFKVYDAAKKAMIYDYIESLPLKFDTKIGERGVRLSGGQVQRIGIARALYKNAEILIFDESTSALDIKTEQSLISSIDKLANYYTIIIITHRESIAKNCDVILKLTKNNIEIKYQN